MPTGTVEAQPRVAPAGQEQQISQEHGDPKLRLRAVIVGLDKNIRNYAVEAADHSLKEKMGQKGFKGFLKRVWYSTTAPVYMTRETYKAKREIVENQNLFHHRGKDDADERVAVVNRFVEEYDEMIHKGAGERRADPISGTSIMPESSPEGEVQAAIHDLIRSYVANEIVDENGIRTDEAFEQEKRRLINELAQQGIAEDYLGEALLYGDNLLQIAQTAEAKIDEGHFEDIQDALNHTDIVMGEGQMGARTELEQGMVGRTMDKLKSKTGIPPYLDEETVAAAMAIGYVVGGFAVKRGVRSVLATIAPGVAGGIFAGVREAQHMKTTRASTGRTIEEGGQESLTGLAAEVGETFVIRDAGELYADLTELYDDDGSFLITKDNAFAISLIIGKARADIRLADQQELLLDFGTEDEIEHRRFELDLALAKASSDFKKFIDALDDDEKIQCLGSIDLNAPENAGSQALNYGTELGEDFRLGEVGQRDAAYRKLRNKRVFGAVVRGTLLGEGVGLAAQELMAVVNPNVQGVAESVFHQNQDAHHQTAVANLFHHTPPQYAEHMHLSPTEQVSYGQPISLGQHSVLTLPEGYNLEQEGSLVTITGPNSYVQHLQLMPDGQLTPVAHQALQASGLHITESNSVHSSITEHTATVSPEQFLKNHHDMTRPIDRDFWWNADNPNGIAYNVNPDGGYTVQVTGIDDHSIMTPGGQWETVHNAAAHGHLRAFISITKGTQFEPIEVPVNPDGTITVQPGSPLASLFENHDGHVVFKGQYFEIAQDGGTDTNGVEHIRPIVTGIGDHSGTLHDTVSEKEFYTEKQYTLTPNSSETAPVPAAMQVAEPDVAVPPIIPIYVPKDGKAKPQGSQIVDLHDEETDPDMEAIDVSPGQRTADGLPPQEKDDQEEAAAVEVQAADVPALGGEPQTPTLPDEPHSADSLGNSVLSPLGPDFENAMREQVHPANAQPGAPANEAAVEAEIPQASLDPDSLQPGDIVEVDFSNRPNPNFGRYKGLLRVEGRSKKRAGVLTFVAVDSAEDGSPASREFNLAHKDLAKALQRSPDSIRRYEAPRPTDNVPTDSESPAVNNTMAESRLAAHFTPSLDDAAIRGFIEGIEAGTSARSTRPFIWQPEGTPLRIVGRKTSSDVEGISHMFEISIQLREGGRDKKTLAFARHLVDDADVANLINQAIDNMYGEQKEAQSHPKVSPQDASATLQSAAAPQTANQRDAETPGNTIVAQSVENEPVLEASGQTEREAETWKQIRGLGLRSKLYMRSGAYTGPVEIVGVGRGSGGFHFDLSMTASGVRERVSADDLAQAVLDGTLEIRGVPEAAKSGERPKSAEVKGIDRLHEGDIIYFKETMPGGVRGYEGPVRVSVGRDRYTLEPVVRMPGSGEYISVETYEPMSVTREELEDAFANSDASLKTE
jgi:hypothetical protein